MHQPQLGIAVLLFDSFEKNKILLAERISSHENGKFGCPGGKVDFGEDPHDTAVRETLEETELDIPYLEPIGYLANCVYPAEDRHFLCIWYWGYHFGPAPTFIEKNNAGQPKSKGWNWYSREELNTMPMMLSTAKAWDRHKFSWIKNEILIEHFSL